MAVEQIRSESVSNDDDLLFTTLDGDTDQENEESGSNLSDKRRMDFRRRIEDRLEEQRLRMELGLDDNW